ncbi:hypothetical protein DSCO28_38610 [Desulfosarcina ovata subsp. sediminis]|uniref:histidine kinase n=1 Tax=Desulfosarcina ovata subsp. sediminis TaxID=885957 RepID=A0A5K7ZSV5_9BACT|nr:histidine kinase [Desulfosarcina ovata]BBO83295.1 hypothetical protein DSCO28_38610 [Desulfosarcina ovata subsp. sediminis]
MQAFTGISLKTRLYGLVLAAFIPVAALIVWVAEEQKAIETDAIRHKTMLLAQAAAEAENQQMAATRDLLRTVGDAFLAVDANPQRLSRLLDHLQAQTSGYAAVGIVDSRGRLLIGSPPSEVDANYARHAWLSASLQRNGLAMGSYHGEHIQGEAVLYFGLPVQSGNDPMAAVVFAALDLNRMNRVIFRQLAELPAGSRLILLDENRGMLRYDVDSAGWSIPRDMDPALLGEITRRQSGTLVATDENGIDRIYAFAPLTSAFRKQAVSVVLDLPRAVALAATKRIFTRNLILLAVSALMAVLSIWWAADRFILRRVGAMARASRELAAGNLQARIGPIGVADELSHLAGVFDEMAASLQMRIEREVQVMASLERSREQLRRLTNHQNTVREQERIRIAREMHDQLGQSLTILKMDLSWMGRHLSAADAVLDEKLSNMSQIVEDAMERLHAVCAELRPVILDDFGLAAAIEWQAEAFTRHSKIACRLENDGFEPDLPKEQATALFRIFQETLTNILRHAEADDVIVRLAVHGGELFFQVADNGRGITPEEIHAPDAFGLLGIRERLHPIGGRVAFDGRPGQGTRVTIHLPIAAKGDNP